MSSLRGWNANDIGILSAGSCDQHMAVMTVSVCFYLVVVKSVTIDAITTLLSPYCRSRVHRNVTELAHRWYTNHIGTSLVSEKSRNHTIKLTCLTVRHRTLATAAKPPDYFPSHPVLRCHRWRMASGTSGTGPILRPEAVCATGARQIRR